MAIFGDLGNAIANPALPPVIIIPNHLKYYPTSAADLTNAWAYAEAFPEEIEIVIRQNKED